MMLDVLYALPHLILVTALHAHIIIPILQRGKLNSVRLNNRASGQQNHLIIYYLCVPICPQAFLPLCPIALNEGACLVQSIIGKSIK